MRTGAPRLALVLGIPVLLLLSGSPLGPAGAGPAAPGSIVRSPVVAGVALPPSNVGAGPLAAAERSLASDGGLRVGPSATAPLLPFPRDPSGGSSGRASPAEPRPAASLGWHLLGSVESRYAGAMAYDGADHHVLEFGGDPDFGSTWTFANGTWTNVTLTVHGSPSPRAGGSMVFDPGRNETLLFGGYSFAGSGSTLADTWAYRAGTWTNLSGTVGAAPPARYFAGFAYDRNDSADVLFGGINNSSAPVDGTWELVGGAWSNVTGNQSSSPVSTQSPAFTSDVPDGDAVLFGSGTASAPFQNQTWTFSGNRWTNLTGNLTTAPPGVADAALSPDSAAGGVMLFGGYARPPGGVNLPAWLGETWVFSGGRWTDVGTGAPYPAERELEMMADDPADSGVVLYSGADYVAMTVFEDTWRFASGTWTQVGSPSMPTPRDGASMAYDSTTHQVILFGGSVLNDTWSYAGGTWSPLTTASTPPRRISAALVDDPGDGELVLFGGETLSADGTQIRVLNDTWTFANGTWTNLTATAHAPSARFASSVAYDSAAGAVVLFGGQTAAVLLNDTYAFHAGRWSRVALAGKSPSIREGAAMADDPNDSAVLLFGGYGCPPSPTSSDLCNDTWTYSAGSWTPHPTARAPSPRDFAGLVADPAFPGDVLVGGFGFPCRSTPNSTSCQIQPENDTWTYRAGLWTNLTGAVGLPPDGGLGSAFVEDAQDGYAFLFGSPGEAFGIGSGSWWSLSPGSSTPLAVAPPSASVNPVALRAMTNLSTAVSGGAPPYAMAWSGLPAGCAGVNGSLVSCTPTETGEFVIRVTVSDRDGNTVVSPPLDLNVTTAVLPIGSVTIVPELTNLSVGTSANLTAFAFDTSGHALTGATFAWAVSPIDLARLNSTSGAAVTLRAGDVPGDLAVTATGTYHGTSVPESDDLALTKVTGTRLAVVSFNATPVSLPVGTMTVLETVASGGTQPYAYTFSGLPTGCGGANTANLSCSPLAAGSYPVTVIVTDFGGATAHASLTLSVTGGPIGSPRGPTGSEWELIAVGVVVLVAALATGYFLARRRRPPATSSAPPPPPVSPGDPTPFPPGGPE